MITLKQVNREIDKEIAEEKIAEQEGTNREWTIVQELEYVKRIINKLNSKEIKQYEET